MTFPVRAHETPMRTHIGIDDELTAKAMKAG